MFDARQTNLEHPDLAEIELPTVLHALSDPMRLEIVRSLAGYGECACNQVELPVSKGTASHHFKVLRLAGVIYQWDQGTKRLSKLRTADLEERFPGLLESVLRAAHGLSATTAA